jgi:hypothetical protein
MDLVTVLLNTPLFTTEEHSGGTQSEISVIVGRLIESGASGVKIQAANYKNSKGKELNSAPKTLFIPLHKIDHLLFSE